MIKKKKFFAKDYRDVINDIDDVLSKCELYAKGVQLEDRFINNIGVNGNYIFKSDRVFAKRKYHIKDLTIYGCPKFEDVYPNEIHNPELECCFFINWIKDNLLK